VLNIIRHGTSTDTFVKVKSGKMVQVFSMQHDHVKKSIRSYERHMKTAGRNVRKAGKTLVDPCTSLHQDMNCTTTNREGNEDEYV
jgi:phage regulator Rha-like protein